MRKLFLACLMIAGFAAPAFADDTATMCHLLSDQRRAGGDAAIGTAYEPGTAAKGKSADAAYTGHADIVQIPLTPDLAHRLDVPGGVETAGKVSALSIHKDGRVMFSGQDLSAQADSICGLPPSLAAAPTPAVTATTTTTTTTTATTAAVSPSLPAPPPVVPVPGVTEPVPGASAPPAQQLQEAGVPPAPAGAASVASDPTASMPGAHASATPVRDTGAAPDPASYMPKAGSISSYPPDMDSGAATTYTTTTTHVDSKAEDEGVSKRDDVVWGQNGQ